MKKENFNYIDIFAGCGGLSLGFCNSGKWSGLFAVEKNRDAFETLKFNLIDGKNHYNRPKEIPCKNFEINNFMEEHNKTIERFNKKVDLIMGGPPCQGFSLAGKRNHNDIRNSLVHSYIEFVKKIQPKIIFFENVSGFTLPFKNNPEKNYSQEVMDQLKELGYQLEFKIVDFSEYGIPQKRKRFILVGFLGKQKHNFFELLEKEKKKFLNKKGLSSNTSVSDAISDLEKKNGTINSLDSIGFESGIYGKPLSNYQLLLRKDASNDVDSHRFPRHNKEVEDRFKSIIKYKLTPEDIKKQFGLKKNTTRLLIKDVPAPTLTTLPDDCVHYAEPRILTVREYARIQSFNDRFQFKGKYTTGGKLRTQEVPRYTQIGNAIPPLFGELVGNVLHKILTDNES